MAPEEAIGNGQNPPSVVDRTKKAEEHERLARESAHEAEDDMKRSESSGRSFHKLPLWIRRELSGRATVP